MGPVIRLVGRAQAGSDVRRNLGRCVQVLHRQAHALHLVRLPVLDLGGVGHVDQGHGAIQLGADLEDTDHVQTLHTRGDTTRCRADFRDDQGELVAHVQAEAPCGDVADDHAELAGFQVFQLAAHNMLGHDRDLAFLGWVDAADLDRLHRAFVGEHAVHLRERHRCGDFRVLHRRSGHRLPIINRVHTDDGGVRHHAENACAHFALEAVHYRQHHDHREHAQGEADHRGHRDKRNKTVAALGAGIARADENR